jgi:hypothetical protein
VTNDRIIEKVKKLLALAQDPAASPNEAEIAGRQAASLMAKYNLDLGALTDRELEAEWDITELSMPGCRPGKRDPKEVPAWIGIMAFGVKLYTRTRCLKSGGFVKYRGPRQDVELAQWMLRALIDLAYKQSKASADPGGFRNGFAAAIQRRLKDMTVQRDQADREAGSTALVVVDKLKQKMDELYGPEGGSRKSNTRSTAEGYSAGQNAHIPTARPVTGKAHPRLAAPAALLR